MRALPLIALSMAVQIFAPAAAQDGVVERCSTVTRLRDGGLTFEPRPDIHVGSQTSRAGPIVLARPGAVVRLTHLRESLIPQALDLEVLRAGATFSDADIAGQGERALELRLVDGTVRWDMVSGAPTGRDRGRIDAVAARMNASLRPGAR